MIMADVNVSHESLALMIEKSCMGSVKEMRSPSFYDSLLSVYSEDPSENTANYIWSILCGSSWYSSGRGAFICPIYDGCDEFVEMINEVYEEGLVIAWILESKSDKKPSCYEIMDHVFCEADIRLRPFDLISKISIFYTPHKQTLDKYKRKIFNEDSDHSPAEKREHSTLKAS